MQKERDYIRVALAKNELRQIWLINRLEEKGIVVDKTELSSVLSGARRGKKAESIIITSADILHRYEDAMCKMPRNES